MGARPHSRRQRSGSSVARAGSRRETARRVPPRHPPCPAGRARRLVGPPRWADGARPRFGRRGIECVTAQGVHADGVDASSCCRLASTEQVERAEAATRPSKADLIAHDDVLHVARASSEVRIGRGGGSEHVMGDELVEVSHVRRALELERHLPQPREPQLKLCVQVEGCLRSPSRRPESSRTGAR